MGAAYFVALYFVLHMYKFWNFQLAVKTIPNTQRYSCRIKIKIIKV
jgi:regulatory protein YycH of two-component signal transduction system YycFG